MYDFYIVFLFLSCKNLSMTFLVYGERVFVCDGRFQFVAEHDT